MIDRQIVQLLLQPAWPADGSVHRPFGLSEAEEYILAVLRKKSRSGLQHFCLGFHADGRATRAIEGLELIEQAPREEEGAE